MGDSVFKVVRIEGEYAYVVKEENGKCGLDELFIAMALLPDGTDIGTRLYFSSDEFEILT